MMKHYKNVKFESYKDDSDRYTESEGTPSSNNQPPSQYERVDSWNFTEQQKGMSLKPRSDPIQTPSMNRFYKKMHSKNKHAKDKKSSNYKTKANVKAKETMTVEQQTALDLRSRIRQSNMCLNPSSNSASTASKLTNKASETGFERPKMSRKLKVNKSHTYKAEKQRRNHIAHLLRNDPRRFRIVPFAQNLAAK
mmetsp:Transcript_40922/g.46994  ORF Transcript_40922/g.46994 Transcript_40922/m.46994 type:complete len:194 (+) Transcript_40922:17-598(+)